MQLKAHRNIEHINIYQNMCLKVLNTSFRKLIKSKAYCFKVYLLCLYEVISFINYLLHTDKTKIQIMKIKTKARQIKQTIEAINSFLSLTASDTTIYSFIFVMFSFKKVFQYI